MVAQHVSQDDRFEVMRHSAALVSDLRDGLLFDRQYLCVSVKPMSAKERDFFRRDLWQEAPLELQPRMLQQEALHVWCGDSVAAAPQPAVRSPAAAVVKRVLQLCLTPL